MKFIFCERFHASCCILPTIFKKPTISGKIVGFLKIVSKIQQLVQKRSQKINYDVILHYISLPIYPLHFPKFYPIQKHKKNTKKLSVFDENDSRCLSNFLQTHIFWNFDHISRICNEINYRNIWFPKVILILIMTEQVLFFNVFSKKEPHLNVIENLKCSWKFIRNTERKIHTSRKETTN